MKVLELVKVSSSLLSTLAEAKIMPGDVKYIEMYNEYSRMKSEGHKITYIVAYLSDVYEISERAIYNVINKFEKEI